MGRAKAKGKKSNTKRVVAICVVVAIIVAIVMGIFVFMPQIEKAQYELKYQELIEKYAEEYNLDPYFVAAVIHTESGFDAEAVSGAGAIGLMQIMPETGEWIAGKLGKENFSTEELKIPETNIEMGCWYLQFLTERFEGNLPVIMAAYNAGHNRVKQWLEDVQYSSDGKNIDAIPYKETENYVKKVTNAYEKYKELYEIG